MSCRTSGTRSIFVRNDRTAATRYGFHEDVRGSSNVTCGEPFFYRARRLRTLYCLYMPDTVHDVTIVDREQN